jgi:hypothetical protein
LRAPTTRAAASAENPEAISTATPPAKSSVPPSKRKPPPKTQWARTGYTAIDHTAMKTR